MEHQTTVSENLLLDEYEKIFMYQLCRVFFLNQNTTL